VAFLSDDPAARGFSMRNTTMNTINFPTASNVANTFGPLDDRLLFDVYSAPLEVNGKQVLAAPSGQQRVIYREIPAHDVAGWDDRTGDYVALGVVGDDFPVKSHREYFPEVLDVLSDTLPANVLEGAEVKTKVAFGGAFALLDITLPNSKVAIETAQGWRTDVAMRSVVWHGLAGSHSNNVLFGSIDFFCTNGLVLGDFSHVKRKNTKNFNLGAFCGEVKVATEAFYRQARDLQVMAQTPITIERGISAIDTILGNVPQEDRKRNRQTQADKMRDLWLIEANERGANVFALLSAFTNYSSHVDNGFALRETGTDHGAVTMLKREVEVVGWTQHPAFTSLYREAA
jgi:hypothetical protein